MNTIKIGKDFKNHDKINSLDLRSFFENENLVGMVLKPCGSINNEEESFAIDLYDSEENLIETFLYSSEFEYSEDIRILSNLI